MLKEQVQSAYQAPVVATLPLSSEMAQLASSGLFSLRFPDHPLTHEIVRVAKLLQS
jgi:hypothetical protein